MADRLRRIGLLQQHLDHRAVRRLPERLHLGRGLRDLQRRRQMPGLHQPFRGHLQRMHLQLLQALAFRQHPVVVPAGQERGVPRQVAANLRAVRGRFGWVLAQKVATGGDQAIDVQ